MAEEKAKQLNGNGKTTASRDDYDDYDNLRAECGVGSFKPAALSMCANMSAFTGIYCVNALLSNTLSTYVNSQVTTLERHFGFNSTQTGLIMAANDVGFLVVVLFISYIAAKVHIPRALGFVAVLFGISGIICALPQFLFGAPSPNLSGVKSDNVSMMSSPKSSSGFSGQICDGINDTSVGCASDDITKGVSKMADSLDPGNRARANTGAALVIIVVGMLLQGIAKAPRSSFVTTYIDANVDKVKTGFYMGIIIAVAIMGPALAFALGGVFARIYVTLEETDMHFRHPRWIGAWWLGYIIFGCAACVFAIPLFFFPRRVKGGKRKKNPVARADRVSTPDKALTLVKGFMFAMLRLWTNPVYMCVMVSNCALLFAVAGGHSFSAKYIENQFSFPTWKANMAMAGVTLGTACLGTFLGGYLSKRLKMGPIMGLKFVVLMQGLSVFFTGLTLIFTCQQPHLYNSPGPRASTETMLSGCHDDCTCDDGDYFPVCGDDGRTFFSPCHAGCLESVGRSYMNCTCIAGGTAVAGTCDYGCSMFYPYIIVVSCSALFSTLAIIPKLILYIRSVEERDKPLALGFTAFMSSITGWMLGPICFGKLIDGICIQWEHSCTGGGACHLYDNDSFRFKLIGFQTLFRFLGFVFVTVGLVVAKVTGKFENSDAAKADGDTTLTLSLMNGGKGDNQNKEKTNGLV